MEDLKSLATNRIDSRGEQLKELSLRTLSSGLFLAILLAVQQALSDEGPPPVATRDRSRGPSSPGNRSRRASRSGA